MFHLLQQQRHLSFCLLCCLALDSHASEATQAVEPTEIVVVKSAENVDLKEVVTQPLLPSAAAAPELVPVPAVADKKADDSIKDAATPAPNPPLTPASPEPITAEAAAGGPGSVESASSEDAQEALTLLQTEVLPGTAARLAWSPSVSFMGVSAPTAVLVVNGVKRGPTVCLTAAIHGDELNGIEIVRRVLYNLDPKELSGAVIGVPIVNLEGFRAGSRYLSDRRDLNRFFPGNPDGSAASRIAHSFFYEVLSQCDRLIDLHTGSFRRTNLPQLRADLNYPSVEALSREMGSIVVLQSKGAKGSLRRAATENGIPAVTLEAGAPHELKKSAFDYGVKSVESALSGLGLTKPRTFRWRTDEPVYYKSIWVRASEGGILLSEVTLGTSVKQGDLLGVVTNPITNQRSEMVSPANGRVIGMALNQVMHPGFAAYHIGIRASVIDAAKDPVSDAIGDDGDEDPDAEPATDSSGGFDDDELEDDPNAGVLELGEES